MNNELTMYLKITGGFCPNQYLDPETEGKKIVKCSLLKETNLNYSNSTNQVAISDLIEKGICPNV